MLNVKCLWLFIVYLQMSFSVMKKWVTFLERKQMGLRDIIVTLLFVFAR